MSRRLLAERNCTVFLQALRNRSLRKKYRFVWLPRLPSRVVPRARRASSLYYLSGRLLSEQDGPTFVQRMVRSFYFLSYGWRSSIYFHADSSIYVLSQMNHYSANGRFAKTVESYDCEDCPFGWFQGLSKQVTCRVCPSGYSQNEMAQPSCKEWWVFIYASSPSCCCNWSFNIACHADSILNMLPWIITVKLAVSQPR